MVTKRGGNAQSESPTGPRPAACRKQASRTRIPLFALGELIGKRVRVQESSCKGMQGIGGTVLDETANTFVLETPRGRKTVPKRGSAFLFPGEGIVDGSALLCRPEDRTKKLAKLAARR